MVKSRISVWGYRLYSLWYTTTIVYHLSPCDRQSKEVSVTRVLKEEGKKNQEKRRVLYKNVHLGKKNKTSLPLYSKCTSEHLTPIYWKTDDK